MGRQGIETTDDIALLSNVSNYSAPSEWGDLDSIDLENSGHLFPIIPPQVNGATGLPMVPVLAWEPVFPIIPPQVNGATRQVRRILERPEVVSNYSAPSEWGDSAGSGSLDGSAEFPIIPPQVNGATPIRRFLCTGSQHGFPIIPPQVNGATALILGQP
jgi:hypothetical protein